MHHKPCFGKGIKFINDLTNNDHGSFYTYDELTLTFNVTINFLQYSSNKFDFLSVLEIMNTLDLMKSK